MPLHTRCQQPQHWSLPHSRFTCWWNHQDLNFQRNHWLQLDHWWRTKVYPWPQWCIFCWRSQWPPSIPDPRFCKSELHYNHQEQCFHNLLPQWFNIYMALPPAWIPNTTSLFYHGTTWECYIWWNHILPYIWTTRWCFILWPLKTNNSTNHWDHILLPCTPKFPQPYDWIPTSCMEWPHTLTCTWQKLLAYLYFNQPRTCPEQNTSQSRLRMPPSTSPWYHE